MEESEPIIVEWINHALGAPEGVHYIPVQIIMATFVLLFCFAFFTFVRSQLSMENPGRLQQVLEVGVEFLGDQLEEVVGHGGRKFLNIVGTLGVFILFSNLMGLIPGLAAPTSNLNVTVGCAILVFFYYNIQGMREQGIGKYLKHFMGPVWWLAPLMIPIETISHIARPFSLSVRLFANIFAEELLIVVFFGMVPLLLPLPFMAYAIFGGILQAFIFVVLTMVYLGGAVAAEDH